MCSHSNTSRNLLLRENPYENASIFTYVKNVGNMGLYLASENCYCVSIFDFTYDMVCVSHTWCGMITVFVACGRLTNVGNF